MLISVARSGSDEKIVGCIEGGSGFEGPMMRTEKIALTSLCLMLVAHGVPAAIAVSPVHGQAGGHVTAVNEFTGRIEFAGYSCYVDRESASSIAEFGRQNKQASVVVSIEISAGASEPLTTLCKILSARADYLQSVVQTLNFEANPILARGIEATSLDRTIGLTGTGISGLTGTGISGLTGTGVSSIGRSLGP